MGRIRRCGLVEGVSLGTDVRFLFSGVFLFVEWGCEFSVAAPAPCLPADAVLLVMLVRDFHLTGAVSLPQTLLSLSRLGPVFYHTREK